MVDLSISPSLASDEYSSLVSALSVRLNETDMNALLVYMVDSVDSSVLTYLAEQFNCQSIGWGLAESDESKRNLIKSSVAIHRKKGTPWAIREMIRKTGLGDCTVIEGLNDSYYDDVISYDGSHFYGDAAMWAVYQVDMNNPITIDQAEKLQAALLNVAPARSTLIRVDFQRAALRYDGFATFDGSYTYGVINV